MYIGAGFDAGGGILPFSGKIGELIVVNGTNEEVRQKVEGYLAHKWGLASQLASRASLQRMISMRPTYPPIPLSKSERPIGQWK